MVEFTGSAYSRTKSNHYSFFFFLHFTVSQHSEFLLHVNLHEVVKSWVSYNTNEVLLILEVGEFVLRKTAARASINLFVCTLFFYS